ncbi:hypothetical protein C8J57DRAFT_1251767 [Mycena rebaudengoi]|nr:hypothetical protein C8J57DRAFT_1251767 [Mycena rebaudengoi]
MFVGAYSALVKALCFSQKLQHLRQRCLAQVPELYPLQHLWLVQSPAWLKNVREASSPAWVKNLGRASMRSTELWPRLNVLCRILWSLQHGPKIRRSLAWLKTLGGASAGGTELPPRLNVLRRTLWSLQLGSKVCLQLDLKIPAKDAGVGTILELEPDISGGVSSLHQTSQQSFGEWHKALTKAEFSSLRQTSRWSFGKWHRPSTKAECAKHCGVSSLTQKSQLKMLEWTSPAEVLELRQEAQRFDQVECAPPNIVESPAWVKNIGGASATKDAGVDTILEHEPDVSGGGSGASARSTVLRPRLYVVHRTLWSLQRGSQISVDICLQLGSKISAELRRIAQSFDQG